MTTYIRAFNIPLDRPLPEAASLIGGKAANLTVMATELGLPVPPGFAIKTDTCRTYLARGWPDDLDTEIRDNVTRLEGIAGRRFGDPANPLLVSVRSGAPVSMPGMMDTILNLGMNASTAAGLARQTGDPAFAEACLTRFHTMYQDVVGVEIVPEDPWGQLRGAVEAVFRSWNSDRAKAYRAKEGIPDDLGTGVIVQAMVFGNLGEESGTGVLFTRNPATGEDALYGDVLFRAQGEDVVAGTHATEPIANLADHLPEIAAQLAQFAGRLEHHYHDMCDIEFTIEQGRLWMLQTRIGQRSPQAALRIAREMADDAEFPLSRADAVRRVRHLLVEPPTSSTAEPGDAVVAVTRGLAASPGLACGEIAVTAGDAIAVADAGRPVILVRRETSPNDVRGMARATGILTALGGLVSHAAVVARGWGIPAVVGATGVDLREGVVTIGDHTLAPGDIVTINGSTGDVFLGRVGSNTAVVPDAATLLTWAGDLGMTIGRRPVLAPSAESTGQPVSIVTNDGLVATLGIKAFSTAEELATCLFSGTDEARRQLDLLVADGLLTLKEDTYELTDIGRTTAEQLLAADRDALGADHATAALNGLVPLDRRMKDIVTAWQMRTVNDELTLNDHSDTAYDASVLADFGALSADAATWMAPFVDASPQIARYAARLGRATERAVAGNTAYLTSPRLDSYHSIWFELHEYLIQLTGRTREEETAAGRA